MAAGEESNGYILIGCCFGRVRSLEGPNSVHILYIDCNNKSCHTQLHGCFWKCNTMSQSTMQVSSGQICDVVNNLPIVLNKDMLMLQSTK